MAKSSTPRHSKSTRKPATIDLDSSQIKRLDEKVEPNTNPKPRTEKLLAKPVHDAEPVGDFAKAASTKPAQSAPPDIPKEPAKKPAQPADNKDKAPFTKPASGTKSNSDTAARDNMQSQKTAQNNTNHNNDRRGKSGIFIAGLVGAVAGLAGAFIVLYSSSALQQAGWLPAADTTQENTQIRLLQDEVATLQKSLANLNEKPLAAQPDEATLNAVKSATDKADNALSEIAKISSTLSTLSASIEKLSDQENIGSAAPDDERFRELETKINSLQALLQQTQTDLIQAQTQASQAASTSDSDKIMLNELKTELDEIKRFNAERAKQPDAAAMAASMIAANSLRSAIDRGGSFLSELETFKSVAPANTDISGLESYANLGIPTITELSNRFTSVADKIVATTNQLPSDASMFDQLKASAKNLVSIRPVGNVMGNDVGAITARIETSLQEGDIDRALSEWDSLPASAKAVSADFMEQLKARRHADNLLNIIISETLKPANEPNRAVSTPASAQ